MTASRPRLGARQLDSIRSALTPRDYGILDTLGTYQLAIMAQLQRLYFINNANTRAARWSCSNVLRKLRGFGLVTTLSRRIGGQQRGSTVAIWHLTAAGNRFLEDGRSPGLRQPRLYREPSLFTVRHTLAITEVAVVLAETARTGACEVIEVNPEPASWRTYLNAGGGLAHLKPDLFTVTAAKGSEFEDIYFVEVDRGTESLPTIVRKAQAYELYRQSGREQEKLTVFPLVLWIMPDERRGEQILEALRKAGRVDAGIHRAITMEQLPALVSGEEII